ncbi:hypothetical protein GCM10009722_31250 [Williamsia deligens]
MSSMNCTICFLAMPGVNLSEQFWSACDKRLDDGEETSNDAREWACPCREKMCEKYQACVATIVREMDMSMMECPPVRILAVTGVSHATVTGAPDRPDLA